MMTIVTELGKSRYNPLHMGMCASKDIFQAKVDELLGDIKGAKNYFNGILVLINGCFRKHMEQLGMVFGILSVCLWVRSPRPHSLLIIGWWGSSPRA